MPLCRDSREVLGECLHLVLAHLLVVAPALLLSLHTAVRHRDFLRYNDHDLISKVCRYSDYSTRYYSTDHVLELVDVPAALDGVVLALLPQVGHALRLVNILALLLVHGVAPDTNCIL